MGRFAVEDNVGWWRFNTAALTGKCSRDNSRDVERGTTPGIVVEQMIWFKVIRVK